MKKRAVKNHSWGDSSEGVSAEWESAVKTSQMLALEKRKGQARAPNG